MCIACRQMKPKNEMLRIIKDKEGNISLDFKGKAAGRGAYICDCAECIEKCTKRKLLNKCFSMEIPSEIYDYIQNEYTNSKA